MSKSQTQGQPEKPDEVGLVEAVPRVMLNSTEAAAALGISKRKLSELVANRASGIPVWRSGRKLGFPIEPLRRWVAICAEKGRNIQ